MKTLIANTQYKLSAGDVDVVLALARAGTLPGAAERLSVDASTVFRTLKRIEKGLGQRLFETSRAGYLPSELAQSLAGHAEQMEAQLEAARSAAQASPEKVSGAVRISTTDTLLHGLVAPALKQLRTIHPMLTYDLRESNEHLVGKHVGAIRVALFAAKKGGPKTFDAQVAASTPWIAPDDAMPEHLSVLWRKKHFPKVIPSYRVNSILTVAELVGQGLGLGLLPLFLSHGRADLLQLTDALDECQTELWLLTHTESRHLRRVSAVFGHLTQNLRLT
jgi:DNA-binding transcriptional LysR family regulator